MTTYVQVEHEPGVWVRARVEKQWRFEGRWRLSVYYYLGVGLQHYRVFDADQCRALPADHAAVGGRHSPDRHTEGRTALPSVLWGIPRTSG